MLHSAPNDLNNIRSRRMMQNFSSVFRSIILAAVVCGLTFTPRVHAAAYTLPEDNNSLLGAVKQVQLVYEDTFAIIARRTGVGFSGLQRANPGIDEWLPGAGVSLALPTSMLLPATPRQGVVINLAELRMYFFPESGQQVFVYPIGIGSEGRETPVMQTSVVGKIENPTWYPPQSVRDRHAAEGDILPRVVPPGPDNPLGPFAIQLARSGYFIHGTNAPIGVGQRVSSGCIRMYNNHVASLVATLPNRTSVRVIDQPYKAGWQGDDLYLEAHPPLEGALNHSQAVAAVISATKARDADVDWGRVVEVARTGSGLPVRITR
ncbi:MAG: L,D-transpeptidase family protein [Pseudomonadales bacterium]|jgi:L,D-transpeptidase ErfK/SrfK|nr:L,D-transpeptidase family protein [Pseudomonadales bacterium]